MLAVAFRKWFNFRFYGVTFGASVSFVDVDRRCENSAAEERAHERKFTGILWWIDVSSESSWSLIWEWRRRSWIVKRLLKSWIFNVEIWYDFDCSFKRELSLTQTVHSGVTSVCLRIPRNHWSLIAIAVLRRVTFLSLCNKLNCCDLSGTRRCHRLAISVVEISLVTFWCDDNIIMLLIWRNRNQCIALGAAAGVLELLLDGWLAGSPL